MTSANERQVGGTHYQSTNQHWDVMYDYFGPSYGIGNATKYVTRARKKNGLQDLQKAAHYIQKTIEWAKANFGHWQHTHFMAYERSAQFCIANKLTIEEQRVLELLWGQWSIGDLHEALGLVEGMINALEAKAMLAKTTDGMKHPFGYKEEEEQK